MNDHDVGIKHATSCPQRLLAVVLEGGLWEATPVREASLHSRESRFLVELCDRDAWMLHMLCFKQVAECRHKAEHRLFRQ